MSDEPTTSGQSAPAATEEVEKRVEGTSPAAEASEAPATAASDAKPSESEVAAKETTEDAQKEDSKNQDRKSLLRRNSTLTSALVYSIGHLADALLDSS